MSKIFLSLTLIGFLYCNFWQKEGLQIGNNDKKSILNEYSYDEFDCIDTLPLDSIKILYGKFLDTLYGYRRNDTLIVEKDILMNIPEAGIKGVATTVNLWKTYPAGFLTIHYGINKSYEYPDRIYAAIKEWSDKTGIVFKEWRIQDLQLRGGDYVIFTSAKRTESYVGRNGGEQVINIGPEAKKGNIMHEIGHCLGLYHEQSRKDRDTFIEILCPNDADYRHAYKTDITKDKLEYNYYSIMHYSPDACLNIPKNIKNNLPKGIPGQRDSITYTDYYTIRLIYKLK